MTNGQETAQARARRFLADRQELVEELLEQRTALRAQLEELEGTLRELGWKRSPATRARAAGTTGDAEPPRLPPADSIRARVLAALNRKPGQVARELADDLELERGQVHTALGQLRTALLVRTTGSRGAYRWHPMTEEESVAEGERETTPGSRGLLT